MKADWPGERLVVASRGTGLRGPLNRGVCTDGVDVVDMPLLKSGQRGWSVTECLADPRSVNPSSW